MPARCTGRVTSFKASGPTESGATWRSWNSDMRDAANSSAARSAEATRPIAAAKSADGTSNDCPSGGAQPSNRLPSSLRARSPSVRTREQISATAARSSANCERSKRRKAKGEAVHDRASNLLTGMVRRLAKPRDHRLHRGGSGLQAGLVGDEAWRRGSEDRGDPPAGFAPGPAAPGPVPDAIGEAGLRRP